ncbi:peptidase S41, partial [bacterium]
MKLLNKVGSSVLLLLIGIGMGLLLSGQGKVGAIPKEDYESLETFTNILAIVKKNYVDDVNAKDLVTGAINGMLG